MELMESAKDGLELVPPIRDAMRHYSRAEYKACWQLLHSTMLLPQLEWDLYLRPHLQSLYQQICEKCIMEYVRPYQRVSLVDMQVDLGLDQQQYPNVGNIEDFLVRLIGNGQLTHAKLDTRDKVLIRQWNDEDLAQRQAQKRMAKLGRRVLDDAHAMIIRWACLEHDLIVRAERSRSSTATSANHHHGMRDAAAGGGASHRSPRRIAAARSEPPEQLRQQHQPMAHEDEVSEDDDVEEDEVHEEVDAGGESDVDEVNEFDAEDDHMMDQAAADNGQGDVNGAAASESSGAVVADIPMADANQ
jgi:COP9 signalosome complex subunit 1